MFVWSGSNRADGPLQDSWLLRRKGWHGGWGGDGAGLEVQLQTAGRGTTGLECRACIVKLEVCKSLSKIDAYIKKYKLLF